MEHVHALGGVAFAKALHDPLHKIDAHLPPRARARVRVRGRDARRWARGRDGAANDDGDDAPFDRVLVDAPCSSERHVLLSADELARWTRGRVSENARRQAGLLVAALVVAVMVLFKMI